MHKNLLVVILFGLVFALLLPLTGELSATEEAFTPDNLIRVELLAK